MADFHTNSDNPDPCDPSPPKARPTLTGTEKRRLRARGQRLAPSVQLGREGITPSVLAQIDEAFHRKDLIKIRLGEVTGSERKAVAEKLAEAAGVQLAGVTGRTALLYRPQ